MPPPIPPLTAIAGSDSATLLATANGCVAPYFSVSTNPWVLFHACSSCFAFSDRLSFHACSDALISKPRFFVFWIEFELVTKSDKPRIPRPAAAAPYAIELPKSLNALRSASFGFVWPEKLSHGFCSVSCGCVLANCSHGFLSDIYNFSQFSASAGSPPLKR